jgi:Cys-tRNA(Pro) deacylase
MNSFKQSPEKTIEFLNLIEEDLENIRRVKNFCDRKNLDAKFEIHPKAESVEESVKHSPVKKEQIIKTLVFKAGDKFIAALTPGNKRADTEKLKKASDSQEIRMAKPKEVKNQTGYTIGGVSPFDLEIPTYIDKSLLKHSEVRPAAGSRVVGIETDPTELKNAVEAETLDLTE